MGREAPGRQSWGARLAGSARAGGALWYLRVAERLAFYALAVAALDLAVRAREIALVAACAVAVGALGIGLHRYLARSKAMLPRDTTPFQVGLLAALLVAGIGICAAAGWRVFSAPGFTGLSLAAFGWGQLLAELRESPKLKRPSAVFWWLCLALLAAEAMAGGGGWLAILAVVVALALVLGSSTELVLDGLQGRSAGVLGLAAGAAGAIALGGVVALRMESQWKIALLVTVCLAPLVGMIAANTDADVAMLVVVVALVWSQFPRSAGPQILPQGRQMTILALGDSYISGEGAKTFYDGTNLETSGPSADQCRRSPTAYPVQVAKKLGATLEDLACSGAVMDNLTSAGQYLGENPAAGRRPGDAPLSQLALYRVRYGSDPPPNLVLVSIGGNDINFSEIVQTCLSPGDCTVRGQAWLENLGGLTAPLAGLYRQLRTDFGAAVVAVPYPVQVREQGCSLFNSTLTLQEQQFLYGFVNQLDTVIEQAAAQAGVHYLAAMRTAFAPAPGYPGARFCDVRQGRTAVNYLSANPVQGQIDPLNWLHDSMHPNARGQARITQIVESWLAGGGLAQPPEPVGSAPVPVLALSTLMGGEPAGACGLATTVADCRLTDSAWVYGEARAALGRDLLGSVLLLVGLWGLWVSVLWRTRAG